MKKLILTFGMIACAIVFFMKTTVIYDSENFITLNGLFKVTEANAEDNNNKMPVPVLCGSTHYRTDCVGTGSGCTDTGC